MKPGDTVTLLKYVIVASSLYYERQHLVETSTCMARKAKSDGWEALTKAHQQAWHKIWDETDVVIQGDPEAQQGIRYNISNFTKLTEETIRV